MKKRTIILIVLIILVCTGISFFIYFPKSIESTLSRIKDPFEVGDVFAMEEIDDDLTFVLYRNKTKSDRLQNVLLRKQGPLYEVIENNGSVILERPKQLESKERRADILISWYDKSDKYVIMAVARDENVETILYRGQELMQLNVNGYRLFWGYGIGEYEVYELFDKNGNRLEHIKE